MDTGADLVLYSWDKLLGGPQAGLMVGKAAAIQRCRPSTMARALRPDKLQIAALERTLIARRNDRVPMDVPVVATLEADLDSLTARASRFEGRLSAAGVVGVRTSPVASSIGRGGAPGIDNPSTEMRIAVEDATSGTVGLRQRDLPVAVRVNNGDLVIDLRTALESEDALLTGGLRETFATRSRRTRTAPDGQ